MWFRFVLVAIALGGLVAYPFQPGQAFRTASSLVSVADSPAQLTDQSKLTLDRIGNVRVGMTVAEASASAGIPINLEKNVPESGQCGYAQTASQIAGLSFMLEGDLIVRIEVRGKSAISTVSGAKIGDTEARIKALYPGQVKVTPHAFNSKGHYLTVVPKDGKDQPYRLIFETDGNRVTAFHAGQLPQVSRVEGCW